MIKISVQLFCYFFLDLSTRTSRVSTRSTTIEAVHIDHITSSVSAEPATTIADQITLSVSTPSVSLEPTTTTLHPSTAKASTTPSYLGNCTLFTMILMHISTVTFPTYNTNQSDITPDFSVTDQSDTSKSDKFYYFGFVFIIPVVAFVALYCKGKRHRLRLKQIIIRERSLANAAVYRKTTVPLETVISEDPNVMESDSSFEASDHCENIYASVSSISEVQEDESGYLKPFNYKLSIDTKL